MVPRRGQNFIPPVRDPEAPKAPPDLWVHAPEYRPVVAEAWRVTEALVRAMRDDARAAGASFAVVVHSGPWIHDEERWKLMLMLDPAAAATWDRRKPSRLMDEFLAREGIPFVDLFEAFEAAKTNAQLFFRVNPHWTPAGHRVAAHAAADFLFARGLVPQPARSAAPAALQDPTPRRAATISATASLPRRFQWGSWIQ